MVFVPEVFEGVSVDDVVADPTFFAECFERGKLLAFRGVVWEKDDRSRALYALGGELGWVPGWEGPEDLVVWDYEAIYRVIMGQYADSEEMNRRERLALAWHIENFGWRFPMVAAGWYMDRWEIDDDCGNTAFIDCSDLYESLSGEMRDFADRCVLLELEREHDWVSERPRLVSTEILSEYEEGHRVLAHFENESSSLLYTKRLVQPHISTGQPLLRLTPTPGTWDELLYQVDGETPKPQHFAMFRQLQEWVHGQTFDEKADICWWAWKQHDFIVVDLHSGIHAVNAGFVPEKRNMMGIWCHQNHPELGYQPRWENSDSELVESLMGNGSNSSR